MTSAFCNASIGGKTGINNEFGKNKIGTVTQPKAVFSDIDMLNSLPQKEYKNAMAEIIKHALISDEKFFYFLVSLL